MTRISSLAANQVLLEKIFNTQKRVLDQNIQVTTEKKSQDYQGVAGDSRRLVNVENSKSLLERFISNNEQVDVRLQISEQVVESFRSAISDFRNELQTYASGEKKDEERVNTIQTRAFETLKNLQNLLNTDVDGRFMFGGSRHNQEPVDLGLTTIEAFQSKFDGTRITYPTTRDAHLEEFSIASDTNNTGTKFITETNFLQFRQDSDGVTTTGGTSTIEASSAMFSNVAAGTYITVANTTNNNGNYSVQSVSTDGRTITVQTEMLTDETNSLDVVLTYPDPLDATKNLSISDAETGPLNFSRSGDTITATTANSLTALQVGDTFTVSNSGVNNGTYTVSANTGSVITIAAKKFTDEGTTSANAAAATFYDTYTDTDVAFTTGTNTIEVFQSGTTTAVPDIFNGLAVGNKFDIVTASGTNDGNYTIASIAADGSSVTVQENLAADQNGGTPEAARAVFTGATTGSGATPFSYTSGTQMVFSAAGAAGTDTIQIQSNAAVAVDAFSKLKVGQQITVSGTIDKDAVYTINAISADGSTVTVDEDIAVTGNETDNNGARMQVFSVAGTVSAASYFNGDNRTLTHRVDDDRSFNLDLTAVHPSIEKAIRAISIILQGTYQSEGGLDQNSDRTGQAEYLLEAALERTVSGTAPFGAETAGSIEQVQIDMGFNRVLIKDSNAFHKDLIGFFDNAIIDMENINMTETLGRLLDDQRSLEASFQIFARVRDLSLTNFI